MFGKKKASEGEVRKLLHDLRAAHHAAKLNAEAAQILVGRMQGEPALRLQKHLALLHDDLERLGQQMEKLAAWIKKGRD